MKKCIFHYPSPVKSNPSSGSEVRPSRMLNAFKNLGYDVYAVTGYSQERAKKIKELFARIAKGEEYDFVYSENTTMPTALSDKDHVPRHPIMDDLFLRRCRKEGIPVGLFYRDAYWQFPLYKEAVSWYIPLVTIPLYKHELRSYRNNTDVLFVPSNEFARAIGYKGNYQELPPGGDEVNAEDKYERNDDCINIFYVGGVNGLYDITIPTKVISELPNVRLTICCRKTEWDANSELRKLIENKNNIRVIHKIKSELESYYKEADLTMALFERNEYRDLAMPVKLFEYIGYGKPVIVTRGTAAGRYILENNAGWAIDFEAGEFKELLCKLVENREEIIKKTDNVRAIMDKNTWTARAASVVENLKKFTDK